MLTHRTESGSQLLCSPTYLASPSETPLNLVRDSDSHSQILCERPHCPRILLELTIHEDNIGLTLHSGDVSMSEPHHLSSNTYFVKDALSGVAVSDGTDSTNKNFVSVSLLHCLGAWYAGPPLILCLGWTPPVETSIRSTPCSAKMPANRTVSSERQEGSFGRDSSSQSVAEMLRGYSECLLVLNPPYERVRVLTARTEAYMEG